MDLIKTELLHNTPLKNAIVGARTCWKSFDRDDYIDENNIGKNNEDLLKRLILVYKHESIAEHVLYTFKLSNFSRAILQELVRHRTGKYSVESTRYIISKVLKNEKNILDNNLTFKDKYNIVKKYHCIPFVKSFVAEDVLHQFETVRYMYLKAINGVKNDEIKYMLHENWRVANAVITFDLRNLRHYFKLRLSKRAHFEIRYLSYLMLKSLPSNHLFLFEDIIEQFCDEHNISVKNLFTLENEEVMEYIIGSDRFENKTECWGA